MGDSNKAPVQNKLIFDIGLHTGKDARFYLDKGFVVVGVEANPMLCAEVRANFASEMAEKRMHVIEKALAYQELREIEFFINPFKSDWGSIYQHFAEREAQVAQKIKVPIVTLSEIFDAFGVPYYIKCDIEGGDSIFVQQLLADKRKPTFVSVEAMQIVDLARLYGCGYDRFQIVNQQFNHQIAPPNPPREGRYVKTAFDGHMSGLFGLELNPYKWITFEEACERYTMWRKLHNVDQQLAVGWLDFHAGYSDYLHHHTAS